ncbi:DnaJ region [Oesophagostomum dentatum]|uniref:DnaJ region n=1 Tax=Oesophagostomum dentatum TaxID=61180 RepID=A0A0B1T5P0_OESDE|nr:DnaJ region [Oesophagostomum dentatum]
MISQRLQGGFFYQASCNRCGGSGHYNKNPCQECEGHGQSVQRRQVSFSVPAGTNDKDRVRFQVGKNQIYMMFNVAPSLKFRRDKDDIHCDVEINIAQAVLGGTVKVPGIMEDTYVHIPPGTASHTKMRLSGKGVKRLHSAGYGDQYIHIKVVVPRQVLSHLSAEQRALMLAWAATDKPKSGTVKGFDEYSARSTQQRQQATKESKTQKTEEHQSPVGESGAQRSVDGDSNTGFLGKLKKAEIRPMTRKIRRQSVKQRNILHRLNRTTKYDGPVYAELVSPTNEHLFGHNEPGDAYPELLGFIEAQIEFCDQFLMKISAARKRLAEKKALLEKKAEQERLSRSLAKAKVPVIQYLPPYFKDESMMALLEKKAEQERLSRSLAKAKVPVIQYLPPYFKDESMMCPPQNEEAKHKLQYTTFDPLVKEDKKCVFVAVLA